MNDPNEHYPALVVIMLQAKSTVPRQVGMARLRKQGSEAVGRATVLDESSNIDLQATAEDDAHDPEPSGPLQWLHHRPISDQLVA